MTNAKTSFQMRCSENSFFTSDNSTFNETMIKHFDGVCETFVFVEGKEFCKHTDIERISKQDDKNKTNGVTSEIDGGFIASLIFVSMYSKLFFYIMSTLLFLLNYLKISFNP